MTDATALLQSILSDPADDLPRLLYADHLDERGEGKRAEFVRVQVELERPIGQSFVDVEEIFELRRRERELLLHRPWPQWFTLPRNREGYYLNGFGFETQNQQGIGITPRRGFISSIRLSWADWLRHHEALYWHPKQMVECAICEGRGFNTYPNHACHACQTTDPDTQCSVSTGRIPRPFVPTAHPITRVELTTWPQIRSVFDEAATALLGGVQFTSTEGHRFDRVKCSECKSAIVCVPPCDKCSGKPLNEWHCDQWPTITFVMPDSR